LGESGSLDFFRSRVRAGWEEDARDNQTFEKKKGIQHDETQAPARGMVVGLAQEMILKKKKA